MRVWASRLHRFWRLSPRERLFILWVLTLHGCIRFQLRCHGLRVMDGFVLDLPHVAPQLPPDLPRMVSIVRGTVSNGPLRGNCLSESLTLQHLLNRSGHACTLRIGARRSATGLEAHAWVELNGIPVNDGADVAERFPPFPGLPKQFDVRLA